MLGAQQNGRSLGGRLCISFTMSKSYTLTCHHRSYRCLQTNTRRCCLGVSGETGGTYLLCLPSIQTLLSRKTSSYSLIAVRVSRHVQRDWPAGWPDKDWHRHPNNHWWCRGHWWSRRWHHPDDPGLWWPGQKYRCDEVNAEKNHPKKRRIG
jgi:hypothetical protein